MPIPVRFEGSNLNYRAELWQTVGGTTQSKVADIPQNTDYTIANPPANTLYHLRVYLTNSAAWNPIYDPTIAAETAVPYTWEPSGVSKLFNNFNTSAGFARCNLVATDFSRGYTRITFAPSVTGGVVPIGVRFNGTVGSYTAKAGATILSLNTALNITPPGSGNLLLTIEAPSGYLVGDVAVSGTLVSGSPWVWPSGDSASKTLTLTSANWNNYGPNLVDITPTIKVEPPPADLEVNVEFEAVAGRVKVYETNDLDNYPVGRVEVPLNTLTTIYKSPSTSASKWLFLEPQEGYDITEVFVDGTMLPVPPGSGLAWSFVEYDAVSWFMLLNNGRMNTYGTNPVTVRPNVIDVSELQAPLNRLYVMDSDAITELAAIPIYSGALTGTINSGQFIINLLKLPFKIPEQYIGGEAAIKIGTRDLPLTVPVMSTDIMRIDLGTIEVPALYGNSRDFDGATYELILPFVPTTVDLNPSQVVGRDLAVEYVLDGYNGDVTVNVYNDPGDPIVTVKSALGRSIPIRILDTIESDMGGDNGVANGVRRAYIRRSIPELVEGQFNNLVSKVGTLEDVTGYVEVSNIELNVPATLAEKQQIKSILASGVIIK